MSKALSLPGLRMGWIIAPDDAQRARIIDARSYFTISSSPLLERLAAHALEHSAAITDRLKAVATVNIAVLDQLIAGAEGRLQWVRPQNTAPPPSPWLGDGRDSRPLCEALAAQGVLLAPVDCFGQPAHIRLGFAQQADGFAIAAERIATALALF